MINSATGMKMGERYAVENSGHSRNFSGFFLDGKYYLGPELLTAIGWLDGQDFYYDEVDAIGDPVFAGQIAGTIEDLTLIMVDGTSLKLAPLDFHASSDDVDDANEGPVPTPSTGDRSDVLPSASTVYRRKRRAPFLIAASASVLVMACVMAVYRNMRKHQR
jgi:hypothetical protein